MLLYPDAIKGEIQSVDDDNIKKAICLVTRTGRVAGVT